MALAVHLCNIYPGTVVAGEAQICFNPMSSPSAHWLLHYVTFASRSGLGPGGWQDARFVTIGIVNAYMRPMGRWMSSRQVAPYRSGVGLAVISSCGRYRLVTFDQLARPRISRGFITQDKKSEQCV